MKRHFLIPGLHLMVIEYQMLLKFLMLTNLKKSRSEWKIIAVCVIIGIIGFLVFITALHDLSN
jgi:mannose/fructose/N-acetylgalactosamine-specific phosphotransferase system component IID